MNDFKPIILAQLGDPPPPDRATREAVYDRIRAEFDAMVTAGDASAEQPLQALEQAIDAIEADLDLEQPAAPDDAPTTETAEQPQAVTEPAGNGIRTGPVAAAIGLTVAILAAGSWYFLAHQDQPARPGGVIPQKEISVVSPAEPDPNASDKTKSFQDALRNGDGTTTAFLLQSGYRPTRVELRAALLAVQFNPQIQVATAPIAAEIHDIACTFTTFSDVRKPMTRASLFDAEDAYSIMKQIGQEQWKTICAADQRNWRDALAKIEQQYAQYNKPEPEKKGQAQACVRRFTANEALDRWEQANCRACPEGHSNCEPYCPQAPKATDAEEARFFSFNRSDMLMAGTMSRSPNASSAELYCNLQYLTRSTDFDLANLQRFKALASLFN